MNSEFLARMPASFQALAKFASNQKLIEKEKIAAKTYQESTAKSYQNVIHQQTI